MFQDLVQCLLIFDSHCNRYVCGMLCFRRSVSSVRFAFDLPSHIFLSACCVFTRFKGGFPISISIPRIILRLQNYSSSIRIIFVLQIAHLFATQSLFRFLLGCCQLAWRGSKAVLAFEAVLNFLFRWQRHRKEHCESFAQTFIHTWKSKRERELLGDRNDGYGGKIRWTWTWKWSRCPVYLIQNYKRSWAVQWDISTETCPKSPHKHTIWRMRGQYRQEQSECVVYKSIPLHFIHN